MSEIKQKRYYIDRDEDDKIIFSSTGRKNQMIREPSMKSITLNDDNSFSLRKKKFQDKHSCNGYNVDFCDIDEHELEECGLDAPYRWFWSKCRKRPQNGHHDHRYLIFMLENQIN